MFLLQPRGFAGLRKTLRRERRNDRRHQMLMHYLTKTRHRYWESMQSELLSLYADIQDTLNYEHIDQAFIRNFDMLLSSLEQSRFRGAERAVARLIAISQVQGISEDLREESILLCIECDRVPSELGLRIATKLAEKRSSKSLTWEELEAFRLKFLRSGEQKSLAKARRLRKAAEHGRAVHRRRTA